MKKVCGIGICDVNCMENGKLSKCYKTWYHMLERCYSSKLHKSFPTYIGCTVHPEWHLFSKFKEFYDTNYREGFQLDKDILVPGNKIYSKETCRFVPHYINYLFTNIKSNKDEFPTGVHYRIKQSKNKPYIAALKINNRTTFLGNFATIEEASNAYNQANKEYCISVANREYDAGNIPIEIRDAIINRIKILQTYI